MSNNKPYYFWIPFGGVIVIIIILLGLYFCHFNGEFSSYSDDWSNWANYIGEVGTFLMTGLNVWIFFKLTQKMYSINKNSNHLQLQNTIMEQLNSVIEPILLIQTYSIKNDHTKLKQLYLYIAWVNFEKLFNKDIDDSRENITKKIEYFIGKDKNRQAVNPCAANDTSQNIKQHLEDLQDSLRSFQSDLPQAMMDIIEQV